jgi:hypothetical protein
MYGSMYVCVCMLVCMYVCMYMYVYIWYALHAHHHLSLILAVHMVQYHRHVHCVE